ncbi:DUF87 domain-containing protein [Sphaerospermopsis sp. FACHB-1194]|uniref:helicase HerA domain-containing protein n=1 Tax=Sphaerospermopsis sp. FACHB-1194 TaxID=2692862 RepID=UPI0016809DDE|nr:DUF87 domain-containing protein [Sphaerospermopsis sp. FACHB-1194]MBD2148467.1 DUF87 domain-containing protein [Sphaerospermopsis sp. FACHB-1194]
MHKQTRYEKLNLEFASFGLGAISLTLALLASIGNGIGKREICFSPKGESCKLTKIATIPDPYFVANQHKSSNPDFNSYAFLSSDNLTTVRRIKADNPNKLNLGIGAILFGGLTVGAAAKLRESLSYVRPHYLGSLELNSHIAGSNLAVDKQLIDYSANELLKHLKPIKSSEAKLEFLRNITPVQINLLLMSMGKDDYHDWGYLLDGGKSFDKYGSYALAQSQESTQTTELVLEDNSTDWVKSFLSTTCLIWGNQGSGKSWLARYLLREKSNMGYQIVVLDPNSNAYEWQGVRLINTHSEIENYMREYVEEVMGRYEDFGRSNISEEEWRANLWKQGKAVSVLCEEVSTYADFIEDKELISKFFKVALTLSRKQELPVIFVAHNNTQSCLGNIKGLANLIERSQQIQPLATTNPTTKQPISSGTALLKIENSNDWVKVALPKITEKIRVFGDLFPSTSLPSTSLRERERERLEELYSKNIELSNNAKNLLDYLLRTNKKLITAAYIQPNFKVNGNRFSADQIRLWLKEIADAGYGDWDGNVLKLQG